MGEKLTTYIGGLIALAVVLKNGSQVSGIINQFSKSLSMFSNILLGGSASTPANPRNPMV